MSQTPFYTPDRTTKLLKLLHDLTNVLDTTAEAEFGYQSVIDTITLFPEVDSIGIYQVTSVTKNLSLIAQRDPSGVFPCTPQKYQTDILQANLTSQREPQYTNYEHTTRDTDGQKVENQASVYAFGIVPIVCRDEVLGVLKAASHTVEDFCPAVRSALELVAANLGSFIVGLRANDDLKRQDHGEDHAFINIIDDLVLILDHAGTILSANRSTINRLGYSSEALSRMSVFDLHRPTDRREAADILEATLTQPTTLCPLPLITRSGEMVPVETRVTQGQWGGQPALFGVSRDISVRKSAESALQYRSDLENLISAASTRFISLPLTEFDQGIQDTLASIGAFTKADRSYIFLFATDADTMSNTHEWCAPEITPQLEMLQTLPNATFPWWTRRIKQNKPIVIPDVTALPPEAATEQELLEAQDIHSVIVVPIWQGTGAFGFLGLDAVREQNAWSDDCLALLRMIGDILANALLRRRMEEALRESQERLSLAVDGADIGIWDWDLRTDTVIYSDRWATMLGYTPDELEPSIATWERLVHPDDASEVSALLAAHLDGKTAYYASEHRLQNHDGTWQWVMDRGKIVERSANGKPLRAAGTHLDITDRKQAEAKLQQYRQRLEDHVRQRTTELHTSEKRYRAIVEQAQEGIVLLDRFGRVVEWNQQLVTLTGVSRADMLDRPIWEHESLVASLDVVEDISKVKQNFQAWFTTPAEMWPRRLIQTALTLPAQKTNIPEKTLALRIFPVKLGDALLLGILVSDITSEIQALGAAQENERRYTALFERANDAVFVLDLDGRHIAANRQAHEMLGYEMGELLGKQITDTVVPEELHSAQTKMAELLARGSLPLYERHFRAKNGTVVPVEINISMVQGDDGRPAQIQSIVRDLRKRNETQTQLRLQAAALNAAADGIIIADANGTIEWANPAFARLTGYSIEEAIERKTNLLNSDKQDATYYEELWHTINSGSVWRNEIVNRRKDGSHYTEANTITPLTNSRGEVTHFIAIKQDITEKKEMEYQLRTEREQLARRVSDQTADLRQANTELAHAVRAKDEFLASMSHELRTPLAAILGFSEVLKLQHRGTLNDHQLRFVGNIEQSGRHLLDLINDILDLAKIESGKLNLTPGTLSISEIAQESLVFVKQMAVEKHIQVKLDIAPEADTIRADRRRLKQILVNLLNNAVKFTPENGSIGLDVRGDPHNARMTFSVWDTGIGITAENLPRLFRPFEQIDSSLSRHYAGTGLGLAMVAQLAELHGGGVRVESTPGIGSRFSVALPWPPPPEFDDTVNLTPKTPIQVGLVPVTSNIKILLAEDHQSNVELIRGFLVDAGYSVIVARDGHQALQLAHETKPHLILMDVQMPGLDGLETARQLRQDQIFDAVPIVALTALAMPGDRERCLGTGMDAYLSKPVQLTALLRLIQQLLGNTHLSPHINKLS